MEIDGALWSATARDKFCSKCDAECQSEYTLDWDPLNNKFVKMSKVYYDIITREVGCDGIGRSTLVRHGP